jgi:hypothetical protein
MFLIMMSSKKYHWTWRPLSETHETPPSEKTQAKHQHRNIEKVHAPKDSQAQSDPPPAGIEVFAKDGKIGVFQL